MVGLKGVKLGLVSWCCVAATVKGKGDEKRMFYLDSFFIR